MQLTAVHETSPAKASRRSSWFGTRLPAATIGLVLLFLASGVAAAATTVQVASPGAFPSASGGAVPLPPATAPTAGSTVHWFHPGPLVAPAAGLRVPEPLGPMAHASAGIDWRAFCDPLLNGGVLGYEGLNASFVTLPGNDSGSAPLNFSWSIHVHSGGLPPYAAEVQITPVYVSVPYDYITTNISGNVTITLPGLYYVEVYVTDSTCTQPAAVLFLLTVAGPEGYHALTVVPSVRSGSAPLNISYRAVLAPTVPAGWTFGWYGPSPPANNVTFDNYTYFLPGSYVATAVLIAPSGMLYELVDSLPVNVSGAAPFTTATRIGAGPYPVDVTLWVNRTTASLAYLPVNTTEFTLYTYSLGTSTGYESVSQNMSVNVTGLGEGCGVGYLAYIDPSGNCSLTFGISLLSTDGSAIDGGSFAFEQVIVNLTAVGSVGAWVPTFTFSAGPLNGSDPLNLSLNLTAQNGVPPYDYNVVVAGHGSCANGTFLPVQNTSGSGWNGSSLHLVFDLNQTGYYFADVLTVDTNQQYDFYAPPLIIVGTNVTVAAPLRVQTAEAVGASSPATGAPVNFTATSTGGIGPFTVQWAFGDGTFASSLLGETVTHVYALPGTYDPSVTVTSADGQSVTTQLPAVTVTGPAPPTHLPPRSSGTVGPSPAPPHARVNFPEPAGPNLLGIRWSLAVLPVALAAAVSVVLICAGGFLYRREVRRQGEDLVAPWSAETERSPESGEGPDGT